MKQFGLRARKKELPWHQEQKKSAKQSTYGRKPHAENLASMLMPLSRSTTSKHRRLRVGGGAKKYV